MHIFTYSTLLVWLLFAGLSSAQAQVCDPREQVCSGAVCSLNALGTSTLDFDKQNLIVCLASDASGTSTVWKSMTGGSSAPSSAVVAFNSAVCPDGWHIVTSIVGRTIVGAGSGNTDMKGVALSPHTVGEVGGEETHTLTIAEMPRHIHNMQANSWSDTNVPLNTNGFEPATRDLGVSASTYPTLASGGNGAHNTMMPYVSLLYCQKD